LRRALSKLKLSFKLAKLDWHVRNFHRKKSFFFGPRKLSNLQVSFNQTHKLQQRTFAKTWNIGRQKHKNAKHGIKLWQPLVLVDF
jgi:hypothetical protein